MSTPPPLDAHAVFQSLLVQLVVVILAARAFGELFRWIKQPAVVGEIAAGIVLGPSVFGALAPLVWAEVFRPEAAPLIGALKELGLMFVLFLVGLEFDFSHLRKMGKAAASIAVAGMVVPFVLGVGLALLMYQPLGLTSHRLSFALFMGTALSVTALPVLGRILVELRITRTRLAAVTITAAAVGDACAWILLATVAGLARAVVANPDGAPELDLRFAGRMVGETVLFVLVLVFAVRPVLRRGVRAYLRATRGTLGLGGLAALLALLFLCGLATALIGIFAVFGAFLLGAILSEDRDLCQAVEGQMGQFVAAFFMPIFFAFSGLRTDIGSLTTPAHWGAAGLVALVAVAGKIGGCSVAARAVGIASREALCVGVMMNTRGLMELVVANVGYELGVIDKPLFTALVLMALLTNCMTTPLLLRLQRGTELEPYIETSRFGAKRREGG